ncbi:MAG: hypothetical protein ACO1QB_12210 [Verrucomicrobiales bacterium]
MVGYGLIPAGFFLWSFAALPLAVVTVFWTWKAGFSVQARPLWVFGPWLLLLALFGGVGLAGDQIRWTAFLQAILQVLYGVAFLAILGWVFWHLAKADSHLRHKL